MSAGAAGAVVAQVGICTSLGYSVPAVDAAVRASLAMFADTPWFGRRGAPLRAAAIDSLPWDMPRVPRMQAITAAALDAAWPFVDASGAGATPVFLAVPGPELARPVLEVMAPLLPQARAQIFGQGRSAFFFALAAALAELQAGRANSALVGAVDSLCTREILQDLDGRERLLGSAARGGLVPGEGAAFLLLVSGFAHRWLERRAPQGVMLAAAVALERHHFLQPAPNRADALTEVFHALQHHPAMAARRADVLCTCETGEAFWAEEFVLAALRCPALMPEPLRRRFAGEAFGDLGAAAGAVMTAIGLQAIARRAPATGPPFLLVAGSSDAGPVGACLAHGAEPGAAWEAQRR